jgi:hypothetical protein
MVGGDDQREGLRHLKKRNAPTWLKQKKSRGEARTPERAATYAPPAALSEGERRELKQAKRMDAIMRRRVARGGRP